jgi:hypothetical protein
MGARNHVMEIEEDSWWWCRPFEGHELQIAHFVNGKWWLCGGDYPIDRLAEIYSQVTPPDETS